MTYLEGNRQIYLPQKIQDRLYKSLKGKIDSLLPNGPVIICFIIPLCEEGTQSKKDQFNWKLIRSNMVLITKISPLNDHKLF